MPGIPGMSFISPPLFTSWVCGEACDFASSPPLFITGTRSIEQMGHLPGVCDFTDGCIVQV